MYKLSLLKSMRAEIPAEATAEIFLEQHRRVEAYLRRLILIALRREGITYKRARSVAETVYFRGGARAFINKAKSLLEIAGDARHTRDRTYEVLERLWLGFCCPYRNKLSHGGVQDFGPDDPAPALLLHVNRSFVIELDGRVQGQYQCDPLEHLKAWGLPTGAAKGDDAILDGLGFENSRSPMSVDDVRRDLKGTRHEYS